MINIFHNKIEPSITAIIMVLIAALGVKIIATTNIFSHASKFIWPILGIFFVVIFISVIKFYKLFILKDNNTTEMYKFLPSILFLGCSCLFIGVCGYIMGLYAADGRLMYSGLPGVLITVIEVNNGMFISAVEQILMCAAMAMVCILVSIFISIIWFFLLNKVIYIENMKTTN